MNTHTWRQWRAASAYALAILGIGLAGASFGGEDYGDWGRIG